MRSGHFVVRSSKTTWRRRPAYSLRNDVVELIHLTGGGHIVDLHFLSRKPINPFWTPHWKTMEPFEFEPQKHSRTYGTPVVGRLLSGIAGHSLCLDLFGMPDGESTQGSALHGEAGVLKWNARHLNLESRAELHLSVLLPRASLSFSRSLLLKRGESVVYVRETVKNERPAGHIFQWQQHAALGAPFLSADCTVALPGARGITFPHGYGGREMLKSDREFDWPYAPRFDGGRADLRRVLTDPRRGFVAGIQGAPDRSLAFVCVLNRVSRLAIGYCFRREDFPWVALWEENIARTSSPWRGREKVRGIEFGSSPLPMTRTENLKLGRLFGTPTLTRLPAKGTKTKCYALFLAKMPAEIRVITDVVLRQDSIDLIGASGRAACSLPAAAIPEYLASGIR